MNHPTHTAFQAVLLSFLLPGLALAQDPAGSVEKKPNVLLIVDTSGSMEYQTGSDEYPKCDPNNPSGANGRSRWTQVLDVLTGKIEPSDFSCEAIDRSDSRFIQEYSMPGSSIAPPDANYRNPYHRPISDGCVITPDRGGSPSNAFEWAAPWGTRYPVDLSDMTSTCDFKQTENGFVDTYNDLVRFGLMTFDSLPHVGTGNDGASTYAPNYLGGTNSGVQGAWSYFVGNAAKGKPADCDAYQPLEVGVRNGSAPASEGKMIYFGGQDLGITTDRTRHDRVQKVLLATRPYGATPINGALDDARAFFWEDDSDNPTGVSGFYESTKLSPRFDEYVNCGCREQHIILITDGEPNLDLRPDCAAAPVGDAGVKGVCPFLQTPEEILADLSGSAGRTPSLTCAADGDGASKYRILTHVVGFSTDQYAKSSGSPKECSELRTDIEDWDVEGGGCETGGASDPDLKVCCTLHRLAAAGSADGTGTPYLAPTGSELEDALGDIMGDIATGNPSATRPVRSPGVGLVDGTSAVAFRLLTSYYPAPSESGGLWRGNIERLRWECNADDVPIEQAKDITKGDDFAWNVAESRDEREFITYWPDANTPSAARGTLRPDIEDNSDGLGQLKGSILKAKGSTIETIGSAGAMGIEATDTACESGETAEVCADKVLSWTLGFEGASSNSRCPTGTASKDCSLIGDIMHSTPVIVDRPTAAVEDESYRAFAETNKGRAMMAYVSSNDGIFHGFNLSPNSSSTPEQVFTNLPNNEFFAFIPPAILPLLKSQYPATRRKLLDGVAIVQDVVAVGNDNTGYKLERSLDNANTEGGNTWRTVMVQSFGGEEPGYFALDITDPTRPSGDGGPRFLWQITTTSTGDQLFGSGGTPLIATINLGGVETAVAVLPGGRGASTDSDCSRSNTDWSKSHWSSLTKGLSSDTEDFKPRERVRCYDPASAPAHSLTMVRLDTGKILRTFRREYDASNIEIPGLSDSTYSGSSTEDPFLDSPITGVPAAFPSGAGMVADRIFVGDQDGTMWRVDVSDVDPGNWEMKLFFDAYSEHGAMEGKPIMTAPVLSVDDRGQITVNFSTGDQDLSGGTGDDFYVYSLTEAESADDSSGGFYAKLNWQLQLVNGEHVLGPMSLLGGVLYFSSVDPSTSNACSDSLSRIWGLDYVKPKRTDSDDETEPPTLGGLPRLSISEEDSSDSEEVPDGEDDEVSEESADTDAKPFIWVRDAVKGGKNTTVFGVSLEFVPSCATSATAIGTLIPGNRSLVTAPAASKLQLVFQTNQPSNDLGFTTGFEAITLAPPKTASRILSWAAILE